MQGGCSKRLRWSSLRTRTASTPQNDFNAHHSNWSNRFNARGNQLFDSSLNNNLISLNDGRPTRVKLVEGQLRETSPDITFCSIDIVINAKWNVCNENLGSDHLIIKINLKYQDTLHYNKKLNLKLANWDSYQETVSKLILQTDRTFCNVQQMYNHFIDIINIAAKKCLPHTKNCTDPCRNFVPKVYWNLNLSKLVPQRRLALKQFRQNPTPQNLSLLKLNTLETQRMVRQAKAQSWFKFCDSIDQSTSLSNMWRKLRWMKGMKQHKSYTSDLSKEELLHSLTPDFVSDPPRSFTSSNEKLDADFALHEMQYCFKAKDTSPGQDGISHTMLRNLPKAGKQFLLRLYNWIFMTGHVPTQRRDVLIIPIAKYNHNDSNQKLRPIALLSCTVCTKCFI